MLLRISADKKMTIPDMCSSVHVLWNKAKERKSVIAFRAVDVIENASAPECLVIAPAQLEPNSPAVEKKTRARIFSLFPIAQSTASSSSCPDTSSAVPSCRRKN